MYVAFNHVLGKRYHTPRIVAACATFSIASIAFVRLGPLTHPQPIAPKAASVDCGCESDNPPLDFSNSGVANPQGLGQVKPGPKNIGNTANFTDPDAYSTWFYNKSKNVVPSPLGSFRNLIPKNTPTSSITFNPVTSAQVSK